MNKKLTKKCVYVSYNICKMTIQRNYTTELFNGTMQSNYSTELLKHIIMEGYIATYPEMTTSYMAMRNKQASVVFILQYYYITTYNSTK